MRINLILDQKYCQEGGQVTISWSGTGDADDNHCGKRKRADQEEPEAKRKPRGMEHLLRTEDSEQPATRCPTGMQHLLHGEEHLDFRDGDQLVHEEPVSDQQPCADDERTAAEVLFCRFAVPENPQNTIIPPQPVVPAGNAHLPANDHCSESPKPPEKAVVVQSCNGSQFSDENWHVFKEKERKPKKPWTQFASKFKIYDHQIPKQ